jgi:hypothetical protein
MFDSLSEPLDRGVFRYSICGGFICSFLGMGDSGVQLARFEVFLLFGLDSAFLHVIKKRETSHDQIVTLAVPSVIQPGCGGYELPRGRFAPACGTAI